MPILKHKFYNWISDFYVIWIFVVYFWRQNPGTLKQVTCPCFNAIIFFQNFDDLSKKSKWYFFKNQLVVIRAYIEENSQQVSWRLVDKRLHASQRMTASILVVPYPVRVPEYPCICEPTYSNNFYLLIKWLKRSWGIQRHVTLSMF